MKIQHALILAALCVAAAGCDREAVAARDLSADRTSTIRWRASECDHVVVPQGFALGWTKFNHRLSRWGIGLDSEACGAREFEVTHVGGVFSKNPVIDDEPWVRFSYQRAAMNDDVSAARVSLRDVIGPTGVVSGSATFSLTDLGLEGRTNYVAIIEGVRYDTGIEQSADYPRLYNPARGYTTRGLGARVQSEVRGNDLVISYQASFVPGRSPERVFMNSALPHAQIGAGIDVLIVGTRHAAVTRGSVSFEMEHARPMPFVDPELPEAEERLRTVAVQGARNAPEGFWGLQNFEFALDFDAICATDADCGGATCSPEGRCGVPVDRLGEYIREFAVGVDLAKYDPESGSASFIVSGHTSNASSLLAYYPLRYQFEGGFAWVQGTGDTRKGDLETVFQTGTATFALERPPGESNPR